MADNQVRPSYHETSTEYTALPGFSSNEQGSGSLPSTEHFSDHVASIVNSDRQANGPLPQTQDNTPPISDSGVQATTPTYRFSSPDQSTSDQARNLLNGLLPNRNLYHDRMRIDPEHIPFETPAEQAARLAQYQQHHGVLLPLGLWMPPPPRRLQRGVNAMGLWTAAPTINGEPNDSDASENTHLENSEVKTSAGDGMDGHEEGEQGPGSGPHHAH